jgi:hypothetical protein
MSELEIFVEGIENFDSLSSTEQADFFIYFLLFEQKLEFVTQSLINRCFDELHLKRYSNISAYLSKFSDKRKKGAKFIKQKSGFILERNKRLELEKLIGIIKPIKISDDLFPFDLIKKTRGYIENVGYQASACYEKGLYDASLVMIRKLLETLIIELFEKNNIQDKIKDKAGNYFYLSDLIGFLLNENTWSLGRNSIYGLPKIKKLGDMSAHNRRFNAKKKDIDNIKEDLRIVIEELIHLIDY